MFATKTTTEEGKSRDRNECEELDVLSLVANPDAEFYILQLRALREYGVESETLTVPGESLGRDPDVHRSHFDYLRYFPQVITEAGNGYDLVHANFGLTAPHALAQVRLPVVVSLWGTDVFGDYGWVSKICSRYADAVIVMSERMGEQLSCDYEVIPHGVDFEQFYPLSQERARERLGWDQDAHQILFPSPTTRPEKNFPRAERVVEEARENLSDRVVLQTPNGKYDHDEMVYVMNAADALLLTSKYEGFPNSVKEALACNLPVVSTDVGDVRDRLDGVDHSAVATTDERLVEAVADVLRSGERSDGREAIRALSTERMGEQLRAVYEDVLVT